MRIVLLGPPGSGKGTCAKLIEDLYLVPVITTGNMLRAAVAHNTPLGKTAKMFMDRGELVPDDLVNNLVTERLSEPDAANGFIMDGYPRSAKQASALDESLTKMGKSLDYVLHVNLEDDIIIKRTSSRRSCSKCGAIFNLINKPSKSVGKCDTCGGLLIQRDDDKEDVIINRLKVYRENTRPLLEWYKKKGKVKTIRGDIGLAELPMALKKSLKG